MLGGACLLAAMVVTGAPATRHAPEAVLALLPAWSSQAPERDTPPAVRARIERERRAFAARARESARLPRTLAAGCVPTRSSFAPNELGPPAPSVTARVLGHHVEVVFAYKSLPRSLACRPALLAVVVYSGAKASSTFNNSGAVERYLLRGPRGRVVLDLPWFGTPPYHMVVSPQTYGGYRGREVEQALRCPGTGCLPGYRPSAHDWPMPTPVLPIAGVDRRGLAASLRYVFAVPRTPRVTRTRCSGLTRCVVSYVDPAFPNAPYDVRYRIAGEQVAGCWMGLREGISARPYDDAPVGPLQIAACVGWLGG